MSKLDSTEYHAMEDQQDGFEVFLRWTQLLRAGSSMLICVSLWLYLRYLDAHTSPLEFVTCLVFAQLVEVLAGVIQVRMEHKQVPVLWYALSLAVGLAGSVLYLLPNLARVWLSPELSLVQWVVLGRVCIGFYSGEA
jgi:hypothetical protein